LTVQDYWSRSLWKVVRWRGLVSPDSTPLYSESLSLVWHLVRMTFTRIQMVVPSISTTSFLKVSGTGGFWITLPRQATLSMNLSGFWKALY